MSADADGHFMYFAFGSNLLKERLQLANPTAVFCTTGRLKDYKLNFGLWEEHVDNVWHGGVATIEFCPGAEVWGVIWTLSNKNLTSLDNQEGVRQGKYSPLEVTVETEKGLMLCRTYQMNNFCTCPPSPQYKQSPFRLWSYTKRSTVVIWDGMWCIHGLDRLDQHIPQMFSWVDIFVIT
uniref:Gamma-glutamylcyclotransferase a n=1 Tax=Sphaeramia orbicularis TaxID=375764 RepID=A0A672YTJ5_9TELE